MAAPMRLVQVRRREVRKCEWSGVLRCECVGAGTEITMETLGQEAQGKKDGDIFR